MFANLPLKSLTMTLGIGTTVFGVAPVLAPRAFGNLFGLPMDNSPAAEIAMRSVGARDAINGIGILSATMHNGRVAPWILARAVADGTDTLGVGMALVKGAGSPRLGLLGGIALAATIVDVALYLGYKSAARLATGEEAQP
ncbi:MAG TPA: DUF4267 domain-containing protein, partial [Chloroflexota bacterium]|nr:DUF4267 domain-containing protein [Chloroflexota bacterium]